MITVQNIKYALNTKLISKEYNSYSGDMDVLHTVREVMQVNGLAKESDKLWARMDKQHIILVYDQHPIGYVDIKKTKGQSHYKFGERWCDWSYKGFDVELYRNSIEDCIKMVADEIIAEKNRKDEQKEQAIRIVKLIKDQEKIDSIYSIASICDYINKNKYDLSNFI